MKSLVLLSILGAAIADSAQFTNTSFTGPFSVGQMVPLMWTTGNGLPIKLSLFNSTWSWSIFEERSVLPAMYEWKIGSPADLVSGDYQLSLDQVNGSTNKSPVFKVMVPGTAQTSTMISSTSASTASVTTAANKSAITITWWDAQCGCHKTSAVAGTTMIAVNNYTVPAVPPVVTTTVGQTSSPATLTASGSSTQSTFKGDASRFGDSAISLVVLIAVSAFAAY